MSVDEIIEQINELKVSEVVELKDKLQEQWNVTAAAPAAAAPAAAAGEAEQEEEEAAAFTVNLTEIGDEKIQVIKAVREVTDLGLKEAKELVESAPDAVVAEDLGKDDAEALKQKLEDVGATVELR